jgi:predicted GNAT family N-acyltransferase/uncharacterized damage-inducible protein DinB
MQVIIIDRESKFYKQAIELRAQLFFDNFQNKEVLINDIYEESAIHIVVIKNQLVVGTGRLHFENSIGTISQMAVALDNQKQGVGKLILSSLIEHSSGMKLKKLSLCAREFAVGFYSKFGFQSHGETYPSVKTGIIHQKMELMIAKGVEENNFNQIRIAKPLIGDFPEYYVYYLSLISTEDLLSELVLNKSETLNFFKSLVFEQESYKYQQGKWSVKQVLKHIIDCEKLYLERATYFSKFSRINLPDFDVNQSMTEVLEKDLNLKSLLRDFLKVRQKSIAFYSGLTLEMLDFKGTASNIEFTARSLGYMTVAHCMHHLNVVTTKYLK